MFKMSRGPGDVLMNTPSLLIPSLTPIGSVIPFAGITIPNGWLDCDGSSLSRSEYRRLFNIIGTTYGSVDSDSFNIPDLRGRTVIGSGQGS